MIKTSTLFKKSNKKGLLTRLSLVAVALFSGINSIQSQSAYCTPGVAYVDCSSNDVITSFDLQSISNSSGCSASGYTNYTSLVPAATLTPTQSYTLSVTVGPGGGAPDHVAAWIDYNHSGTFDPSEYTSIGFGSSTTLTSTLTIPGSAMPGLTRMRVMSTLSPTPPSSNLQPADGCGGGLYSQGEAEDYAVYILCSPSGSVTPPVINISSSSPSVCAGGSFTLTASGGATYNWGSGVSTATNVVTAPASTTTSATYTVIGTDMCGTSTTATYTILVKPLPLISATASKTIVCVDDHAVLTLSAGGANSYTWTAGSLSGTGIAFTPTTSVTPTITTTYYVKGVSVNQCSSTASVSIVVSACTSIKNGSLQENMTLYPNPANGMITIDISEQLANSHVVLEFYDALGKLVLRENMSANINVIDIGHLEKGVYFYKTYTNETNIKFGKLVKY